MNKKVAVIFGSMSSEHEISCISAANILDNIDLNKYDVEKIGIDKNGVWYLYNGSNKNILENKWIEDIENKKRICDLIGTLKGFDIVFPVLHGKYGEDGTIQGIFEFAKVKYVGCRVIGSSISMDKTLSKELVGARDIPIVPYINVNNDEFKMYKEDNENLSVFLKRVIDELKLPLFVKPNKEGSSYGVMKVEKENELEKAIEYAFSFDDSVLIEKYISNKKEVECAVIKEDGNLISSTPGMIVISQDVYDFDSKYNDKSSYVKIPADIDEVIINKIKEYSKEVFNVLRLDGLARVDFFVTDKKEIYFNEVNTMPGFTNISMYPKMLMYDGYTYSQIIETLIENCK